MITQISLFTKTPTYNKVLEAPKLTKYMQLPAFYDQAIAIIGDGVISTVSRIEECGGGRG